MKTVFLYFFISRRYILVQISSPLCVLGGISWPVRAWVKGVRWYNQGLPSRVFSPLWRCPRWNTSQRKGEREERGKEWEREGGNGLFLSLATASSSHSPPYPPSLAVASPSSVAALPPAPSSPTTVGQQGVRRQQWQRRWRGRAESSEGEERLAFG